MIARKDTSDLRGEQAGPLDEGWWAAVLSDEEFHIPVKKETSQPVNPQILINPVDWQYVQRIFERDEIIHLKVHGFNRGGLLVQGKGIQGFVPVSHLVEMPTDSEEEERRDILASYVERAIRLKVIECEPKCERVVLSERAALAGEGQRKTLFASLREGAVVSGRVTNITEFGVFVDLGGVEGLIHVSELSWGRVQNPADFLYIDQEIKVLVLQVNEETSRIALSLKRLLPNPWETLAVRYKSGDIVRGWITSLTRFGAFARLDEGVEGLIHISSMQLPSGCKNLNQYLQIGQEVNVRILHIETDRRRLGLGLVQVE
ncbi:MAG: S1 RNA-binding domain-containing protein [Chloroflexota bacterium]|jgi:small subunit ribosomal protein S1